MSTISDHSRDSGVGPQLSVVVPIFNVEDYLVACLESLTAQTLTGIEVVLVDDGSTDASGRLADDFAAGRPGWKVLHVENGGLGRARNIGFDHATAPFVAFVDSDDLIPRDAYELMLHAVSESGSDIVCGGVLRFDGARTFPSPLHRRALSRTMMRTHITKSPQLIFDTTAWNKIYRRDFLLEHGLRYPEGVYYEDIPLTLPAHFLARSVDILSDPVYLWRERQTATQSITQRRAETRNLIDRMAAVTSVDDFLTNTRETAGKQVHDRKVLTIDLPLFLDVLHEGDDEFRATLVELGQDYLRRVAPSTIAALVPVRRLQYHLIQRGMLEELVELQQHQRTPANRGQFVRSGLHMYADLPFRTDAARAIPAAVYEVTRSQPLRTGIRDLRWEGSDLVVDGHAFIHRVPESTPLSSVRRFQLRKLSAAGDQRRHVSARRVRRPDLTGRTTAVAVSYDAAGFLARVPGSELVLAEGEEQAQFELLAQVATPAARRGSSVGNPERGRALHPARRFVAPGQLAIPAYLERSLVVTVRRVAAVVSGVDFDEDTVRFTLRSTGGADLAGRALFLRRTDSLHATIVPLTTEGPGEASVVVKAEELEVRAESLGDREWVLGLTSVDADSEAEPQALLDLDPALPDAFGVVHGRSLAIRQRGDEGVVVTDTRPGHVLTDFSWSAEGLRLSGITSGASATTITLTHASGEQLSLPVTEEAGSWTAFVPATGEPGQTVLRWLSPGRWELSVDTGEHAQRERSVRVSHAVEMRMNEAGRVEGLEVLLRSGRAHELQVVVDGSGSWADRGAYRRQRARRYTYRLQRRLPLEDTIVFESWKGRQYSDNPRAVFEELERRGDPRRRVWAVEHLGVEVPDGVERVIVGSREYFRHIARARWLVTNDSMPPHYVKRDGAKYAQTWHGTPLKRIGFDIDNLQMSNQQYLVQFGRDVAKWDSLVSPNAFSTEILTRAFRYDGEVMEIGYPRNDVFHREDLRAERVAKARQRLGLPEGKRVILYAPTWRDNDYDSTGRYQFTMKLDLERMHRAFGDDSILLIRGHQLVSSAIDATMFEGFVRNVSLYPDISDLYLLADVLVTDYSSVMFDYVNTGRPIVFYTWDLESYRDDLRGFYFDFEKEAPGPLLRTTEQVVAALSSLDSVSEQYADAYAAFRERFTEREDGGASARFIERFLGER
ncbi:MAG TPA: CDP-glycerol glycerophosphotransferase family protein [Oryzihumus sp.]|nr:CDP-glycerol glycerophosphotransferase family protein [Oryzihumus sp.]